MVLQQCGFTLHRALGPCLGCYSYHRRVSITVHSERRCGIQVQRACAALFRLRCSARSTVTFALAPLHGSASHWLRTKLKQLFWTLEVYCNTCFLHLTRKPQCVIVLQSFSGFDQRFALSFYVFQGLSAKLILSTT